MHWTATRQGASVTFSSGETAWDFSPFVHLVCEVQNLADHELFVECHWMAIIGVQVRGMYLHGVRKD